jgi:uncharacterized protein
VRVVLDTNIWVSGAAKATGVAGRVLALWRREKRYTLLTSEAQLEEFRRVSRYKNVRRILKPTRAGALVNLVKRRAEFVDVRNVRLVSPDPDDDFIIAIAEQGNGDYLISRNDLDLLQLKKVGKVHIMTPEAFLKMLRQLNMN